MRQHRRRLFVFNYDAHADGGKNIEDGSSRIPSEKKIVRSRGDEAASVVAFALTRIANGTIGLFLPTIYYPRTASAPTKLSSVSPRERNV